MGYAGQEILPHLGQPGALLRGVGEARGEGVQALRQGADLVLLGDAGAGVIVPSGQRGGHLFHAGEGAEKAAGEEKGQPRGDEESDGHGKQEKTASLMFADIHRVEGAVEQHRTDDIARCILYRGSRGDGRRSQQGIEGLASGGLPGKYPLQQRFGLGGQIVKGGAFLGSVKSDGAAAAVDEPYCAARQRFKLAKIEATVRGFVHDPAAVSV